MKGVLHNPHSSDTFKIATQASLLLLAVPSQLTADQIRSEYPSLTRGQLDVLLPESQSAESHLSLYFTDSFLVFVCVLVSVSGCWCR